MPPTSRRRSRAGAFRRGLAAAALLTVIAAPATAAPPAAASAEYGGAEARLQDLVDELRRLIDRAETADSASPELLQDLRDLVARHDAPFGREIVRDTFQDGTFRRDPGWAVLAGEWQAVAGSVVSPPAGPALATPPAEPDADRLLRRLETVTRLVDRMRDFDGEAAPEEDSGAPAAPTPDPPARLALPIQVPPVFRLRTLLTMEDDPGRHDVSVVLRETRAGETRDGYRLTIEAFATRSRVTLDRLSAIGGQMLGSAVLDQSLAGGEVHTVVLERQRDGTFSLVLNGEPVIVADDRRAPPRLDQLVLERDSGRLIVSEVSLRAPGL